MARTKKPSATTSDDKSADADVETNLPEGNAANVDSDSPETSETPEAAAPEDQKPGDIDDEPVWISDETSEPEEVAPPDEPAEPEPTPEEKPATTVPVVTPSEPPRRSAAPLVLGGILAAVIGAGAAYFVLPRVPGLLPPPDNSALEAGLAKAQADNAALSAELAALKDQVSAPATPDPAIETLQSDLAALNDRVATLESAPPASSEPSPESAAAIDREFEAMRAQLDSELANLKAAQQAAADQEAQATASAREASATALVAQVQAAIDAGLPYGDLLGNFGELNLTAPDALSAHADKGVATLASLQAEFPDYARAALDSAVRVDESDGTTGRIESFLRSQLGVRSLKPREGDDPDAVLSRAEAALKQGDLAQSLSEIETLPEPAKVVMQPWVDQARDRQEAQAALSDLSAQVSK